MIASGSNGNCCLIETKKASILIDAGKSGREIEARMRSLGKSLENVDAVLLTHSHHDHIAGAGVISRRYGIPLYMDSKVYSESRFKLGDAKVDKFSADRRFRVKGIEIRPIATSHNVSSCGFVVGDFGLFTDTGVVTKQMKDILDRKSVV